MIKLLHVDRAFRTRKRTRIVRYRTDIFCL